MANHGVVTLGSHVMDAHFKMETVEHFAKIALVAQQLGAVHTLADKDVDDLIALRDRFGIGDRPACERDLGQRPAVGDDDLVERITEEVMRQLR